MAVARHHHAWHTFAPGTKVLDTVTGLDGVVVASHITHTVEPAAASTGEEPGGRLIPLPNPVVHESVHVKLEDGTTVVRSPRTLAAI